MPDITFLPDQPIDLKKPIIKGFDKTFSTEKTITIGQDNKFFNIPTIINGKEISKEKAIKHFQETGENVGRFNTLDEAISSAKRRSERIGQLRGIDISFLPEQAEDMNLSFLPDKPLGGIGGRFRALKPLFEPLAEERAIQAPFLAKAREVGLQFTTRFISGLGFGLPEFFLEKAGFRLPEPRDPVEAIGAGLGELAGFIKGPLGVARRVAPRIPVVGRAFRPAETITQATLKPLLRGATTLGTASALASITEPTNIPQNFGSGALTGTVFGGISFIPNAPLRILGSSAYIGIPSALRNDPLELQVFNFGLGAYFGLKGATPKQVLRAERPLAKLMREGVEGNKFKETFDRNERVLSEFDQQVKATGIEPTTTQQRLETLLKSGGKYHYEPIIPEKIWKRNVVNNIWNKMKAIKQQASFPLRQDNISFIIEQIPTKTELAKLDNASLFNLTTAFGQATTRVPTDIFSNRPLVKREVEFGKHLNLWDKTLRPGFKLLQKLGFGNIGQGGLTQEFFDADVNHAKFLNQHIEITNNWKRMIGFDKRTSQKMFRFLDGKVHSRLMSSKELKIAGQIRKYFDSQIEMINRYRTQFGENPVQKRQNYITHIFDDMRKDFIDKKYPFPEYLESMLRFIVPKEKVSPFLKARKGALGYVEDVWRALDAYSYRTSGVVNDQPIRRANKITRFIQKEINLNEKIGKRSPIDWFGIKRNLDSYVKDYVGRPGSLDKALRGTLDIFNKRLPPGLQVRSIIELTNTFNSLVYGTTMGFRPKLAIRNLGQHSLIFGEVGTKPFLKAIRTPVNKETAKILDNSKVLATRKLHFAPEIQPAFSGRFKSRLSTSAFWLYRGADFINVRNAFLAGFYEAKAKGLSNPEAYKRGDEVAAKTQYLYLKGNRSALARGLGLSPALGRTAGVFTTWPANWLELQLSWAKPQHREKLLRYIGLNVGLLALGASAGIKAWKYTGIESPLSLLRLFQGNLPITGIAERPPIPPQIIKDINKVIKDEDIRQLFLYTWE